MTLVGYNKNINFVAIRSSWNCTTPVMHNITFPLTRAPIVGGFEATQMCDFCFKCQWIMVVCILGNGNLKYLTLQTFTLTIAIPYKACPPM